MNERAEHTSRLKPARQRILSPIDGAYWLSPLVSRAGELKPAPLVITNYHNVFVSLLEHRFKASASAWENNFHPEGFEKMTGAHFSKLFRFLHILSSDRLFSPQKLFS